MLRRALYGPDHEALDAALGRLMGLFAREGHVPITVPHLFPGETLLDVYGEDLRARAFLFPDPARGEEVCLRPDFTVPVALAHGAGGWEREASYAYQGPVFRLQHAGSGRASEHTQAGVERFGDEDPAEADADVFSLMYRGLGELGVEEARATIGDLSIAFALLDALEMPGRRRAALKRHFWRPARFQALISRAVAPPQPSEARQALVNAARGEDSGPAVRRLIAAAAGEEVGLRDSSEIVERARRLAAASAEPAMPGRDAALITELMKVRGPASECSSRMRRMMREAGVDIGATLDRFDARLDVLSEEGIAPSALTFDAAFGRNLEYYDGFVFEIRSTREGELPPLAGGGRYDAMTTRLGADRRVGAVGGIIRAEVALEHAK